MSPISALNPLQTPQLPLRQELFIGLHLANRIGFERIFIDCQHIALDS